MDKQEQPDIWRSDDEFIASILSLFNEGAKIRVRAGEDHYALTFGFVGSRGEAELVKKGDIGKVVEVEHCVFSPEDREGFRRQQELSEDETPREYYRMKVKWDGLKGVVYYDDLPDTDWEPGGSHPESGADDFTGEWRRFFELLLPKLPDDPNQPDLPGILPNKPAG